MKKKVFFSALLMAFVAVNLSCGAMEKPETEANALQNENCVSLADKLDECLIDICTTIKYSCKVCSCMKEDGSECMYSAHKKLDDCTEEENEEAKYMIDSVFCSEYVDDLKEVCPPPKINDCDIEGNYCVTSEYNNGICVLNPNNYIYCNKLCNKVGYSSDCEDSDEMCYNYYKDKSVCIRSGDKGEGQECKYMTHCQKGNMCLYVEGEDISHCYKVCDTNANCGVNKICVDTELGFNVCVNR